MALNEIFQLPPLEDEWDLHHIEFVMFEIGSGKLYISSKIEGRSCSVHYLLGNRNIRIEYPFSLVDCEISDFLINNRLAILEFWERGSEFTIKEYIEFVESRFVD